MEWTQEAARTLKVSNLPVPHLHQCNWAARLPMTTDCANAILRRSDGLKPAPQVSKRWARRFLEHPKYLVRKQKVRGVGRENARNTGVILEWPQKYGRICDEYGIPPRDIYNSGEPGFCIGVGRN